MTQTRWGAWCGVIVAVSTALLVAMAANDDRELVIGLKSHAVELAVTIHGARFHVKF